MSRACLALLLVTGATALGGSTAAAAVAGTGGFSPVSVTFVSPVTGWVLGTATCASGRCLELRETTDSGRSWSARPLPPALARAADRKVDGNVAVGAPGGSLNVRFADLRDGWIYGNLHATGNSGLDEPLLWATHDGGRLWRAQGPAVLGKQSSILDLEASSGRVHLMVLGSKPSVAVESSPVSGDEWRSSSSVAFGLPAGGGELSGMFVLQGARGWLVEGNDRGTTGGAQLVDGRWVRWAPPCTRVGGSFAVPSAPSASYLVAACVIGGFASPLSKAAPRGAAVGSTWLYVSRDGGRSFRAGPELGPPGTFFDSGLVSPRPGTILATKQVGTAQELRASFDGGRRWTTVHRGALGYLGFTTPSQGAGIVDRSNHTSSMIMTFDGGRHWAAVHF